MYCLPSTQAAWVRSQNSDVKFEEENTLIFCVTFGDMGEFSDLVHSDTFDLFRK